MSNHQELMIDDNKEDTVNYTVLVEAKIIDKEQLAEFLGYSISWIEKRGENELPPRIKGKKNRWFFPVVVQWCLENSHQFSTTNLKKIKIKIR